MTEDPTEIKKAFNDRTSFIKAAFFSQTFRTANEITDHVGCCRRAIERWCDAGLFERYESDEPIEDGLAEGGRPTYLYFMITEPVQEELLKVKKEVNR